MIFDSAGDIDWVFNADGVVVVVVVVLLVVKFNEVKL